MSSTQANELIGKTIVGHYQELISELNDYYRLRRAIKYINPETLLIDNEQFDFVKLQLEDTATGTIIKRYDENYQNKTDLKIFEQFFYGLDLRTLGRHESLVLPDYNKLREKNQALLKILLDMDNTISLEIESLKTKRINKNVERLLDALQQTPISTMRIKRFKLIKAYLENSSEENLCALEEAYSDRNIEDLMDQFMKAHLFLFRCVSLSLNILVGLVALAIWLSYIPVMMIVVSLFPSILLVPDLLPMIMVPVGIITAWMGGVFGIKGSKIIRDAFNEPFIGKVNNLSRVSTAEGTQTLIVHSSNKPEHSGSIIRAAMHFSKSGEYAEYRLFRNGERKRGEGVNDSNASPAFSAS